MQPTDHTIETWQATCPTCGRIESREVAIPSYHGVHRPFDKFTGYTVCCSAKATFLPPEDDI